MKLSAKTIFLLFTEPKEGKVSFKALLPEGLFLVNKATYEDCRSGDLNEVEFFDTGQELTLGIGTAQEKKVTMWKPRDFSASQLKLIDKAIKIKANDLTVDDLKLAASLQQGNL